jgi:hypothetical protein
MMNTSDSNQNRPADVIMSHDLTPSIRAALAQLQQARDYARDIGGDPWEFAVEIERLIAQGVTTSDLRWLAKKGYIEHASEVTGAADFARQFEHRENLAFTKESCFLLTESASTLFQNLLLDAVVVQPAAENTTSPPRPEGLPYWDADDRTLYVGRQVVKEYRVRSPNQEAVLSAFEEEQWPHYIDDPLSPMGDQNPKQRLRDTIKCLNANQKNRLIRFRGDGTGERVRWELFSEPQPHGPVESL